jgi:hypothetical protein
MTARKNPAEKIHTVNIPGLTIKGNAESVSQALRFYDLDPADYGIVPMYYSESKGEYVQITKMALEHLKNAVVKLLAEELNNLKKLPLNKLYYLLDINDYDEEDEEEYDAIANVSINLDTSNHTLVELMKELDRRGANSL